MAVICRMFTLCFNFFYIHHRQYNIASRQVALMFVFPHKIRPFLKIPVCELIKMWKRSERGAAWNVLVGVRKGNVHRVAELEKNVAK